MFPSFLLPFLYLQTGSNARHVPATQIFYDPASRRLTMHIRMEKEGSFQATVTYGDVKLKNGEFNILVLSCKSCFLFSLIFEICFCLTHFKFVESQKQKNIFISMPFVQLCLYHWLLRLSNFSKPFFHYLLTTWKIWKSIVSCH